MKARFVLTDRAEEQLSEIVDYLTDQSESAATRTEKAVYDAAGWLADHPGLGHTRKDLTNRPLKFWSVSPYLIVYDPASRPLSIVAVIHGARDVGRLLNDEE